MAQRDLPTIMATLRQHMPYLSERYAVQSLGVFGSYVRQQQRSDSDFDLLVSFREIPGLLTYIDLENYLTDLLGVRVDLVMDASLKPSIGTHIRHEVLSI